MGAQPEKVAPGGAGAAPAPFQWPAVTMDCLAGLWFWWDTAPPTKKRLYHGRIQATVEGYVLLAFAPHPDLPSGVLELVHISRIAEDTWSLFPTEEEYQAALAGGADDS